MSVKWLKALLQIDGMVVEELKIVYESEWEQDGKWQSKETVVELTGEEDLDPENWPTDEVLEPGFYQINDVRSGSYYSDWEYHDPAIFKVEPYTETVTKYRVVK